MLRKADMDLTNALDSGALAGVALLKDDPVGAEQLARDYVQLNYPESLPDSDVDVGFRCLIGTMPDQPAPHDGRAPGLRPGSGRDLDGRGRDGLRDL